LNRHLLSSHHSTDAIEQKGQVEDPNAYVMGGIAGHAGINNTTSLSLSLLGFLSRSDSYYYYKGIFSTVGDLYTLGHRIMFASPNDTVFLNATTAAFFTKVE